MAIGYVTLRDFDNGVVFSLGGQLFTRTIDGVSRSDFVVELNDLQTRAIIPSHLDEFGDLFPVYFKTKGMTAFNRYVLPCFVVKRNDLSPNFSRRSFFNIVEKIPGPDSTPVVIDGVSGYDKLVTKWQATPFDISYDLEIHAKSEVMGQAMLKYALARFGPLGFSVAVFDSETDKRLYDAGEVAVSDMSEIEDVVDEVSMYSVSFTIQGEIDLHLTDEDYNVLYPTESVTMIGG